MITTRTHRTDDEIRAQVRESVPYVTSNDPTYHYHVMGAITAWVDMPGCSDHERLVAIREWLAVWDERRAADELSRLGQEIET